MTYLGGMVNDLSVAPDGVRVALVVQNGSRHELEVASIIQPSPSQTTKPVGLLPPRLSAGTPLAGNLASPVSLAWYSTDDLITLNAGGGGNTLWEVPVDGQPAAPETIPPGAASITADGPGNVLVAGLAGGHLAVSPGLEGPWQVLANQGQDPAYP